MTTIAGLPAAPRPLALISIVADLFPRAFIAERWQPRKVLKIGIDTDLIATGILTPSEVESALSSYTSHRTYLVATAAGGFRFDLDGNPAGEVAPGGSRMGTGEARSYRCARCPGGPKGGRGPCLDRGPQGREKGR